MSSFGKYSASSLDGTPKKNTYYLKEGSNIFRILPPFKSLGEVGAISKYWSVYWVAATKGKRPVPSLLKMGKDKQVLQQDPMYDVLKLAEAELERMIKNNEPKAKVDAQRQKVFQLSPNKGYWFNVLTPANEIGRMSLPYKVWQSLKAKLKELEKQGFDPINPGPQNGLFFDIKKNRDDKGNWAYNIDVHTVYAKDPTTGRPTASYVPSPIDEVVLERMEKEAFDLGKMFTELSMEDQVAVSSLDPNIVDRVFARGAAAPVKEIDTDEPVEGEDDDEPVYKTPSTSTYKAAATQEHTPAVANLGAGTTNNIVKNFLSKGSL
jgi:hypothetical protein